MHKNKALHGIFKKICTAKLWPNALAGRGVPDLFIIACPFKRIESGFYLSLNTVFVLSSKKAAAVETLRPL